MLMLFLQSQTENGDVGKDKKQSNMTTVPEGTEDYQEITEGQTQIDAIVHNYRYTIIFAGLSLSIDV